jgi:predicted lipid-binding transport protein (Tim44 family)
MMGALVGLFSGGATRWLIIGGGVLIVLVGGWLYLSGLHARVDAAELRATIAKANEQTALRAAVTNADAVQEVKREAARAADLLMQEQDAARARQADISKLKEAIRHAAKSTECTPGNDDPVAPVLLDTLNSLRR